MSSTQKNGGAAGAAKPEDKKAGDKKADAKDDDPLKEELVSETQPQSPFASLTKF